MNQPLHDTCMRYASRLALRIHMGNSTFYIEKFDRYFTPSLWRRGTVNHLRQIHFGNGLADLSNNDWHSVKRDPLSILHICVSASRGKMTQSMQASGLALERACNWYVVWWYSDQPSVAAHQTTQGRGGGHTQEVLECLLVLISKFNHELVIQAPIHGRIQIWRLRLLHCFAFDFCFF